MTLNRYTIFRDKVNDKFDQACEDLTEYYFTIASFQRRGYISEIQDRS